MPLLSVTCENNIHFNISCNCWKINWERHIIHECTFDYICRQGTGHHPYPIPPWLIRQYIFIQPVFREHLLYARLFEIAGAQICSASFSPNSALIYEDICLFCWIFTLSTAQNLKREEVCRVKSLEQRSVVGGWKGRGLWESTAGCSTRDGWNGGIAGPLPPST